MPGRANPQTHLPCGRPLILEPEKAQKSGDFSDKTRSALESYCETQGLNRSEAREKILETILAQPRHFTALDLLAELGRRHPEVGKATVYRNLPILVASGVLQEGPTDTEGHVLYELSGDDHHDHIVCLDCHAIFEFHDEAIEKRQERLTRKLDFEAGGHRHVIYASCRYKKAPPRVPRTRGGAS